MLIEVIAAFFVAYSFGILFNIKGKHLIIAGCGGAIGWFLYKFCMQIGISETSSLFVASVGFSIYCETCARLYKIPSTILSVCCLIPLVPGYGIYNTLYLFLIKNYILAVNCGFTTLYNACALALGIILISALYRHNTLNKKYKKIK
ncbi:threonine/serine exporter family protein [Romboutsia ilealis]|uniref:threonine/serine exporter family protein n=1 Tax=Romboutsia ilealis TaxID=1115758 RepID=UPI0025733072|nr:threonine/serine exporter family protein [Romboutsia ilealis]